MDHLFYDKWAEFIPDVGGICSSFLPIVVPTVFATRSSGRRPPYKAHFADDQLITRIGYI